MIDFFKELESLQAASPRLGLLQINPINSSYNFAVQNVKNCYRIANAVDNEDCMYGRDIYNCADCVDGDHILKCTLCYGCLNCTNCYNGNFLQDCEDCTDCSYGYDLRGCTNCFGCAGLRKKQYYIFNKPYSKEEYAEKIKKLTREEIQQGLDAVKMEVPHIYSFQTSSENGVGNYIHHSKNAFYCFDVVNCQDVGYLMESKQLKDSYDITILEDAELCYEISSSHALNNCNFCYMCVNSSDLTYCEFVNNSKFCFGCMSLNHKEYQILNTQYSKDDYFKKVAEIKDQLKSQNLYNRKFLPSTYPFEDTVATWDMM